MEDGPEGAAGDDVRDVIATTSCLGPLDYVVADDCPGEVSELGEGLQHFGYGDLLDGRFRVDGEQPDEQLAVSHGRTRN